MTRNRPTIDLSPYARDILRVAARSSTKTERGGILIGWRTTTGIEVHEALLVPDETARFSGYRRRRPAAQRLLSAYLSANEGNDLGYIGEWHTHPLPQPPSPTDLATLRLMSLMNTLPVALIVAARHLDGQGVTLHGHVTGDRIRLPRLWRSREARISCGD